MKVRELKNFLDTVVDDMTARQQLYAISHWLRKIKKENPEITDEREKKSLKKIAELKLIEINEKEGKITAKLSKQGDELYNDFYKLGYFG